MEKTQMEQCTIWQPVPGVWLIQDERGSSSYLIPGKEKALLIDAGYGRGDLKKIVDSLTQLPVILAITHNHGDHCIHAAQFEPRFMHPNDIAVQKKVENTPESRWPEIPPADTFRPIVGGDVIDIGGVCLEVIEAFGHTPGSIMFLDRSHHALFTGDAIGSGGQLWMQVPYALPLHKYVENLEKLGKRLDQEPEVTYLGGHFMQAGEPGTPEYNPITRRTIDDNIALCRDIIEGKPVEQTPFQYGEGSAFDPLREGEAMVAKRGGVAMVYRPDNL